MERQAREARKETPGFASSAGFAFLMYSVLAIAMTWPLAAGLSRDATHLGRGWWSANIFAPHPLSLAYSEHFLPQALQALPIYAVTKNPILCYNLLFLS